ncbi:MAG: hypothetical protein O6499_00155 [Candidatus Dadabacteria bacterium]|nr:hypothetical protein [Candidatus Dadabacteria bacterium]
MESDLSKFKIKVGDKVTVNFNEAAFTLCIGTVLSTRDEHNPWIIKADKKIYYIDERCTIFKDI